MQLKPGGDYAILIGAKTVEVNIGRRIGEDHNRSLNSIGSCCGLFVFGKKIINLIRFILYGVGE